MKLLILGCYFFETICSIRGKDYINGDLSKEQTISHIKYLTGQYNFMVNEIGADGGTGMLS
ncbi:MAG: hypothetical protein ACK5JH_01110 [Anaerocolumna sp.]